MDVIVGIIIVGDEGAPIIVTGQLYLVSVDLVHGHDM